MNDVRLDAPAAGRNRDAILDVLKQKILWPLNVDANVHTPEGRFAGSNRARVLEIASGSGQHISHFAQAFPKVFWQPSDPDPKARASISAWCQHYNLANVAAPLAIDVLRADWVELALRGLGVDQARSRQPPAHTSDALRLNDEGTDPCHIDTAYDAIVCINMVHISPWQATRALLSGAARLLRPGGMLYLYGPYYRAGHEAAISNIAFDHSLRQRNADWGIRKLEDVLACAALHGLSLSTIVEMPANNLSVILKR